MFSQNDLLCRYAPDLDLNQDAILSALDSKVVLRDSLSYTVVKGSAVQNDTSKIILPDSCLIVLLFEIKYAYLSKRKPAYLELLERTGGFKDQFTSNYVAEVVQELVLSTGFLSYLSEHSELKNINRSFFSLIEFSRPDSDYVLKIKRWLKQNKDKKEQVFFKETSAALAAKN